MTNNRCEDSHQMNFNNEQIIVPYSSDEFPHHDHQKLNHQEPKANSQKLTANFQHITTIF